MSKICFCICIFYMSTVYAQVASKIEIAPIVSANFYDDNFVYQNSTSYGLILTTSLIGSLSTGISYKTSQSSTEIQMPGNNLFLDKRWHLYQIHLVYDVFNFLNIFQFSPGIGLGLIHFSSPPLTVDLGDLVRTM